MPQNDSNRGELLPAGRGPVYAREQEEVVEPEIIAPGAAGGRYFGASARPAPANGAIGFLKNAVLTLLLLTGGVLFIIFAGAFFLVFLAVSVLVFPLWLIFKPKQNVVLRRFIFKNVSKAD